jgi:AcrB/AcrD/AcrF family
VTLTRFDDRHGETEKVWGVLDHLRGEFLKFPTAIVIPFNLPPIIGLGTGAGFEYQLQSYSGAPAGEMAAVARGLIQAANEDPALAGVFTTYGASTPLMRLDIDRERAKTLGISISDIFTALQATLGGYRVNDFNKFGRTWQVILKAETAQRMQLEDIFEVHVRAKTGALVPIRSLATVENVLGPRLHLPLQQLAGGGNSKPAGAKLFIGPGIGGDGAGVESDVAGRVRVFVERHRLPGKDCCRPDHGDPGARRAVRLPRAGRALRILGDAGGGDRLDHGRAGGRARRPPVDRAAE